MFKKPVLRLQYFLIAAVLLFVEILIALFVNDDFIRPYLGDFLVVILLNCLLMTFSISNPIPATIIVFCIACFIEWLQYLQIVSLLGLQDNTIASVVIGTSFEWLDIVAYAAGCFLVLVIEFCRRSKTSST